MSVEPSTARVENPLSERERDVAQVLATGATNAEIARALHISPHTVKVHIRNIFDKLEVGSRTEASMVLIQHGWVTIPGLTPTPGPIDIPDPEPLSDLDAQPTTWQLAYMLCVAVFVIGLLSLPNVLNRPQTRPDLLSDTGAANLGQPTIPSEPRWASQTPLSQPASRMAVVNTDRWLYVIGGESNEGTLSELAAYDLDFNRWQPLAELPEPRLPTLRQLSLMVASISPEAASTTTMATMATMASQWPIHFGATT